MSCKENQGDPADERSLLSRLPLALHEIKPRSYSHSSGKTSVICPSWAWRRSRRSFDSSLSWQTMSASWSRWVVVLAGLSAFVGAGSTRYTSPRTRNPFSNCTRRSCGLRRCGSWQETMWCRRSNPPTPKSSLWRIPCNVGGTWQYRYDRIELTSQPVFQSLKIAPASRPGSVPWSMVCRDRCSATMSTVRGRAKISSLSSSPEASLVTIDKPRGEEVSHETSSVVVDSRRC